MKEKHDSFNICLLNENSGVPFACHTTELNWGQLRCANRVAAASLSLTLSSPLDCDIEFRLHSILQVLAREGVYVFSLKTCCTAIKPNRMITTASRGENIAQFTQTSAFEIAVDDVFVLYGLFRDNKPALGDLAPVGGWHDVETSQTYQSARVALKQPLPTPLVFTMLDGFETSEACGDLYASLLLGSAVQELPYDLPHVFAARLQRKSGHAMLLGYFPSQTMWFLVDDNLQKATCSRSLFELLCEW